jgi:hypothetical protein
MNNMQRIRLGLLCAKLKLERIHTQDKSYPKDPNPENWRTISGAKVHLTNGKIDGGAAGKFEGNDWVGKQMHASDPRAQNQSLFGGNKYGWGVAIPNEEEHFKRETRIQRRAKERNERYEAKKAEGLAKQAEFRKQAATKSPWEMSKRELKAERERLEKEVENNYMRFSQTTSAKSGYNAGPEERLAQVRAAMGEKVYPWQWNKEQAQRKRIPEAKHQEAIKKAIEQGLPVPEDVLREYRNAEYARENFKNKESTKSKQDISREIKIRELFNEQSAKASELLKQKDWRAGERFIHSIKGKGVGNLTRYMEQNGVEATLKMLVNSQAENNKRLQELKQQQKATEPPQEKTYSALEAVAELRKRRRAAKAAETPKSSTEKTAAPKKKGNMKSRLWDNAKEAGIDLDAFHVGGGRWDKRGTIFLDLDKMPPEKRAAFTQMAKEKGYKVAWNGGLGYSLKEEKAPSAARAPKPTEKTAAPEGYEEYLARKNAGQKNPYEEGQEARRERLENRAEKAASEGQQRFSNARKMMEVIPMGQPILVGHYSERSHRSHLNKIDQNMRKGFEAQEKAQYYQNKAENVGTAGISSMDPDAKFKVYEKLRDLEALQDKMKQENYENGKTYASYEILNNASEIRRLKKRLEELSKVSASEGAIHEENPLYKLTQEEGRYQFKFDGKPDPEVRDVLKRNGFKWSPTRGTWVRAAAGSGKYAMERVKKELEPFAAIPF